MWPARLSLLLCACAMGCGDPAYFAGRRPLEAVVDPATGAASSDRDLFVLPVRRPTDAERRALSAEQTMRKLTQPLPWVGVRDFEIELLWAIKNLEARPIEVTLTVSGGNEFADYQPERFVDSALPQEDQQVPPALLGGVPVTLSANEVRSGLFREDQLAEAALDLEAITRYPDPADVLSTPFVVIEHNSTVSRIGLEQVPASDVTPAMVRFAVGLAASGHVALDYVIRVRDKSGKLAALGDRNLYVSTDALRLPANLPMAMMPAAAMPAMMQP